MKKVENPIQVIITGTSSKAVEFTEAVNKSSNMELLSDNYLFLYQQEKNPPCNAIIVDFGDFRKNIKNYLEIGVDSILNIQKELSFFKKELKKSLGNVVTIENLEEAPCEKIIEAIMLLQNEERTSRCIRLN